MKFLSLKVLLCFSLFCLLLQAVPLRISNDTDTHLSKYSKFNETHHDNLDDEVHSHKHKHKHSKDEDEDEHEHHHEHSKLVQNEFKIICNSHILVAEIMTIEASNGFYEKFFISSPHPYEVFRPPIVS